MEEFFTKTKICFGTGALEALERLKAKRIFLVADPFLVKSGMINEITAHLKDIPCQIFQNVVPDPPLELVVEGIRELRTWDPDTMIAVGGGSAIDEAKAILHFGKRIAKKNGIQFIAIPTTSGTGSEVTSFSVLTDKAKGVKYPLVDAGMLPDLAILDPVLVKSVPSSITADTGMDVLTHALEAYVSTRANPFTDALAEKAALTVFRYLIRSAADGEDLEARAMMHNASCMAGIAFNAVSLGLNHAIAHNIGGKFHIPHGRTNAILLPHVVEYNAQLTDYQQKDFTLAAIKYANLASLAGVGGMNVRTGVKALIHQIEKMENQLKMPTTFRECGIVASEYQKETDALITGAQGDACIATNPRVPSKEDIRAILRKAW